MPDLDQLLKSSLEDVGESYEPSDQSAARERFLQHAKKRRMRIVLSGVAVTAVAVAVALLVYSVPATEDADDPVLPPAAVLVPQPMATIAVGEEPISIAAGEEAVWVANADRVSRIDPASDEVLATVSLEGEGDEVIEGEGSVWVADTDGFVSRFDPTDDGMWLIDRYRLVGGSGNHLDIATAPGRFVAVDPETGFTHSLDLADLDEPAMPGAYMVSEDESSDIAPTDVAADGEVLWLLEGEAGILKQEDSGDTFSVPGGRNADLLVTEERIWVAAGTGGTVVALDAGTGEQVAHEVGGAHTDLAGGDGFVWALTGEPDQPSVLRQFDAATGEPIGEPLELDGAATDVTFSGGYVWITDSDAGAVIKIEPATR